MQKTLYTTTTLFEKVMELLKIDGLVPDIIDYALPTDSAVPIRDYAFDVLGCVNFGCEGIYVDLFYRGDIGDGYRKSAELGTIKTLSDSDDAFLVMAELMARFQLTAHKFINEHLDDFDWVGFGAKFYMDGDEGERFRYGYVAKAHKSFDEAYSAAKHYLDGSYPVKYDYVVLMDKSSGEERTFRLNSDEKA